MECGRYREGISARLDGEDPGMAAEELAAHLAMCGDCRRFDARAAAMLPRMRVAPAFDVPDQTGRILASIDATKRRRRIDFARAILVGLAALELASAIDLFAAGAAHVSRDAAAFGVALAIGLLVAAVRPVLAVGILPVVVALAVVSFAGAFVDVAGGRVALSSETHHLVELVAVGALWWLLRPVAEIRSLLRASPIT